MIPPRTSLTDMRQTLAFGHIPKNIPNDAKPDEQRFQSENYSHTTLTFVAQVFSTASSKTWWAGRARPAMFVRGMAPPVSPKEMIHSVKTSYSIIKTLQKSLLSILEVMVETS